MRAYPEYIYAKYKENVEDDFQLLGEDGYETAEKVTDWMADFYDRLLVAESTSLAIWLISIAEYEIRHDILEDRVLVQLSHYIPEFNRGVYDKDLTEEEYKQVKADVDYILSKVKLYDKVVPVEGGDDDEDE